MQLKSLCKCLVKGDLCYSVINLKERFTILLIVRQQLPPLLCGSQNTATYGVREAWESEAWPENCTCSMLDRPWSHLFFSHVSALPPPLP